MVLPLSEIFDQLPIASVEWTIQRNDAVDITGAGEMFQMALADELWTAPVTLGPGTHNELKQAAALIRSLRGAQQPFLMCDPTSLWPQSDPRGLILGSAYVQVRAIGSSRGVIHMAGFPVGYVLRPGDKLQLTYGGPVKYAFHEISRIAGTDGAGNMDAAVFPWLPLDLPIGAAVTLIRPACPVVIAKDSHRPGTSRRTMTENASFTVIQRRRRT